MRTGKIRYKHKSVRVCVCMCTYVCVDFVSCTGMRYYYNRMEWVWLGGLSVLIDLEKAFDTCNVHNLLSKLNHNGLKLYQEDQVHTYVCVCVCV